MKKLFITWGFVAAVLTLFSCAKQEASLQDAQPAKSGVPFELVAGVDTKTEATDAGVVTWKTGDALNVFHAEVGSTTYSQNDKFTFDSGSSFKGTLQNGALTADAYDWYALYPYYYSIPAPDNTTTGYTTFAASQTQTGNNSMAHLCGTNVPMYGKATGVAKDTKPSITMNQAASIIKVHVTNKVDANLVVESISITAPQKVVGKYYINFSEETPSFTESEGSTDVSLTVSSGAVIAKDKSANFYIVIKPFKQESEGTLTISVNGCEKNITIPASTEFKAGKIKTVNVDYDKAPEVYSWTKTAYVSLAAGDVVVIADETTSKALSSANGTTAAPDAVSVTISGNEITSNPAKALQFEVEAGSSDGQLKFKALGSTNYLYTTNSNNGVRVGNSANNVFTFSDNFLKNVATSRYVGVYNNQDWRCYSSVTTNISSTKTVFFKRSVSDATLYDITINPSTNGTVSTSPVNKAYEGTDVLITVSPDANYKLTELVVKDASDNLITVTENVFVMPPSNVIISATFAIDKRVTALKTSIENIAKEGGSTILEEDVYELVNASDSDLTVTCDGTVVTDATAGEGSILFDVAANPSSARNGWIRIAVSGGNSVEIIVKQLAGVASKTYTLTIDKDDFTTEGYASNNTTKTSQAIASDSSTIDIDWTSYQVYQNEKAMQWQKNSGAIYNNTDLGIIKSVTVNSTAGSFTTYYGTAKQPSSSTSVGTNNGYFQVKVGGATGKTTSIVVVFEK